MPSRFLVLEGVDGSGKSTQAKALVDWFSEMGRDPVHVREPGTTQLGERLRRILLQSGRENWHPCSEALLFFAARRELLHLEITPAMAAGRDVICERFTPSSLAYQGQLEENAEFILDLDQLVVGKEMQPDRVIILDMDPKDSLARADARADAKGSDLDGMEERGLGFLAAVRQGYLRYAIERPSQTCLLEVGGLNPEQVQALIQEDLRSLIS